MKTEPEITQSRLSAIVEDLEAFAADFKAKLDELRRKIDEQKEAIGTWQPVLLDRGALATRMAEQCKSASPNDYDFAKLDFLRIRELSHYCQAVADYCPEEADGVAAYLANSVDDEHVVILSPCQGTEPKPGGMIVFPERIDYGLWNLFDDSRLRLISVRQSERWFKRRQQRASTPQQ